MSVAQLGNEDHALTPIFLKVKIYIQLKKTKWLKIRIMKKLYHPWNNIHILKFNVLSKYLFSFIYRISIIKTFFIFLFMKLFSHYISTVKQICRNMFKIYWIQFRLHCITENCCICYYKWFYKSQDNTQNIDIVKKNNYLFSRATY